MNQSANQYLNVQMSLKNRALDESAEGITITDYTKPDNPIIYANAGFERLTGYAVDDIIGKNCRFLQGPDTDRRALDEIQMGIKEERPVTVELLNYRKDGTKFWNRLAITPVRNKTGITTHFIGIQSDITKRKKAEEALSAANAQLRVVNERMTRELAVAAQAQQSLLPSEIPRVAGFDFAWKFQPCSELGGDMLDIYWLDDRYIGLYLLDVSGHGVAAALLSVTLSRWLSPSSSQFKFIESKRNKSAHQQVPSPAQIITQLNSQFPMDEETGQFFTMNYGVLDTKTYEFRYVSAGHPPLILSSDRKSEIIKSTGFPIGVVTEPEYQERILTLKPGDRLYFYSDGAIEAHNKNGEQYGVDRLLDVIAQNVNLSLEESLSLIVDKLEKWGPSRQFEDDMSLMVVEVKQDT